MLQYEREQPQCLVKSLSRRRRIARGSGRAEVDVSNMLASFTNMQAKVRDLSKLMKMSGANGALNIISTQHRAARLLCLAACPSARRFMTERTTDVMAYARFVAGLQLCVRPHGASTR